VRVGFRLFLLVLISTLSLVGSRPVTTYTVAGSVAPRAVFSALSPGANVEIAGEASPDRQRVEPTIVVDPHNTSIIVAGAQDLRLLAVGEHRWHGFYRSTDGGQTWSSTLLPGFPGDTSPQGTGSPLHVYNTTSDPVMAFDRAGNLYYAGIAFEQHCTPMPPSSFCYPEAAFVAKYTNDGATYTATIVISGFNPADKPWIAVDTTGGPSDGSVYLAFDANVPQPNGITVFTSVFTRSIDGGKTFSTPIQVPAGSSFGNLPGVAIDGAGNVYVSTLAVDVLGNPLNYIQVSKLTNGGSTLTGTVVAAASISLLPSPLPGNSFRTFTIPQMAADSSGVYMVWDDYRTGNSNVRFTRSSDGGLSWSSSITVNDVTADQHFFSAISVAGGGIAVAWYDSRLGQFANGTITGLDVFYAQSVDGGSSFSNSVRITSTSFNPNIVLRTDGPNTLEHFMGDYISITATPAFVYPVWTDNRNACDTTDPTYGCVDQDIFTSAVPWTRSTSVNSTFSLDTSTATTNGTLYINRVQSTLYGQLSVTAKDRTSGQTTFNKLFSISPFSPLRLQSVNSTTKASRFLLNVTVLPYTLSSDLTVQLNGLRMSVSNMLTREVDIKGDGTVDVFDLSILLATFGTSVGSPNYNPKADLNANGPVDVFDLSIFLSYYGSPVIR
jgi:hypothetical protein